MYMGSGCKGRLFRTKASSLHSDIYQLWLPISAGQQACKALYSVCKVGVYTHMLHVHVTYCETMYKHEGHTHTKHIIIYLNDNLLGA